jgi:uncharacterized membrane protein (UPF0127 family)
VKIPDVQIPGVQIVNATRGIVLAAQGLQAVSMGARMKGLLGRDDFPRGQGLIISPCNQIHTFFMRFPIDVIFLDARGRAVRTIAAVLPWRLTNLYLRAACVVELPAGVIEESGTQEGDEITWAENG